MDFIASLPVSTNWKNETYDSILVIVDCLTKIVDYEPVNIMINIPGLAKVIINVVICYHGVLESIVIYKALLFISKFWSLLYYFLKIKKKLFTAFYL